MKIQDLKEKIERQIDRFKGELSSLRTGRATTSLVEGIKVEAYPDSPALAVKELATITIPDPVTIVLQPWDLTLIPKIERAIRLSPGGFNPVVFDDLIRLNLPPLSVERRQELAKVVRAKTEAVKVEIRQIRQDEMRSIDEMEQNAIISEDERFRWREEVEKIIRERTEMVERLAKEKEEELLKV